MINIVSLAGMGFLLVPGAGLPLTWAWLKLSHLIIQARLDLNKLKICIFLFGYSILTLVLYSGDFNPKEYLLSFFNFVIFSFVFSSHNDKFKLQQNEVSIIAITITMFGLIQFLEGFLFRTYELYFVFENISVSTMSDVGRFEAANFLGIIRATSVFQEPSFYGMICVFLFSWTENRFIKTLLLLSVLSTFSITAMLFLILIVFENIRSSAKALIIVLALSITATNFDNLELLRFQEILQPGTSGHERISKPFITLMSSLEQNLFGIPFGQILPQPNNSLFVLFIYFTLGIPIILTAILFSKSRYLILLLLFSHGALITLEGAVLLKYIISNEKSHNSNTRV
jgi:hypothetical protein